MLDVLCLDRIQPLVAEQRDQVNAQNRFLRSNPARLQTIRLRVSIDETRSEFLECGFLLHLLFLDRLWFAMHQQHALACFGPALRCGLAGRRRLLAFSNEGSIRKLDPDVDLPAAVDVRTNRDAHRCSLLSDDADF
ncbi:MAG TPA: hypothetical protein VGJ78_00705 [Vicinamibacterales bacterium]